MAWPEADQRARWKELYPGVQLAWAPPGTAPVERLCRNCATPGPKPILLDAVVALPLQGTLTTRLLDCPACGCAFAQEAPSFDYEHNAANETSVAFYVEVGAGLWPITRALARVEAPPGATYLEIGCGFGFALDYATRERGWVGRGIDPSPIAVAARGRLGLSIENRYFRTDEAEGTDADVIMAGEVVEHMADPLAFLLTLKAALRPGGTLILTTPDRAGLFPGAPLAQIVPILSVGAHVVLETADSLRLLLRRAGFTDVEVLADSAQLTAYASTMPLRLEHDAGIIRRRFRRYLDARADSTETRDFVWWGFTSRAHQEAVVDADWDRAERTWQALVGICRTQFGFDLDDPAAIPATTGLELWELPERVPKALPSILYARALQRMGRSGESLTQLAPLFRAALGASVDLNAALRADASEDQATLGVERSCRAALAAEAADAGRESSLELLGSAIAADPAQRVALARRSLVGLTNTGRTDLAGQVAAGWDVGADALDALPDDAAVTAAERDTLHSLAMLDLGAEATLPRARTRFARSRQGVRPESADGLWWSALRGECVAADRAGDTDHTTALLRSVPPARMPDDLRARAGEPAG